MPFSILGGLLAWAWEAYRARQCRRLGGHDWQPRPDGVLACVRCHRAPLDTAYPKSLEGSER